MADRSVEIRSTDLLTGDLTIVEFRTTRDGLMQTVEDDDFDYRGLSQRTEHIEYPLEGKFTIRYEDGPITKAAKALVARNGLVEWDDLAQSARDANYQLIRDLMKIAQPA